MISKTQILTWVVAILLIMNAVTIGTILYHNYQESKEKDMDNIALKSGTGVNMLNGKFFRQTLGFNEQQMNTFRKANQLFRPIAMDLTYEVDSLKNEMFIELKNAMPDTVKLNGMSEQIGALHGRLKYSTYQFYLSLKSVCTAEQIAGLENAFLPLFKSEEMMNQPGHQRGMGPGNK